jgi:hypothetical protein
MVEKWTDEVEWFFLRRRGWSGDETRRESIEPNRFEGQSRGARGYHPRSGGEWAGEMDIYLHDDIAWAVHTVQWSACPAILILGDLELNSTSMWNRKDTVGETPSYS